MTLTCCGFGNFSRAAESVQVDATGRPDSTDRLVHYRLYVQQSSRGLAAHMPNWSVGPMALSASP